MKILYKNFDIGSQVRSAFVCVENTTWDCLTKASSIIILRDDDTETSVREILATGLSELAKEYHIVMVFPNPIGNEWNFNCTPNKVDDITFLKTIHENIRNGILGPEWKIMNDVNYLMGIGQNSCAMVTTFITLHPELIAAAALVEGNIIPSAITHSMGAPMPALLANCSDDLINYYKALNNATALEASKDALTVYVDSTHPFHKVTMINGEIQKLTCGLVRKIWFDLFYQVRRINTSPKGNICRRIQLEKSRFEKHLNDCSLGDNGGIPHSWLEHVPQAVLDNPSKPVPLLIFSHGATDNPMIAADMSKWHEIGEREGFITVYPAASNGVNYNLNLDPDYPSDVDFYLALIRYLKNKYAIDSSRIYISGFSNGAGMANVMCLLHPEIFAAAAPFDTMWPYVKPGPFAPDKFNLDKNLKTIIIGLELQKKHNYRMPIWYVYGTREFEYPIVKGLGQQYQYDTWKKYNNIAVLPTPEKPLDSEDSIGVQGETIEVIYPCPEYPEYKYSIHKFYSIDDHKDYYNFVLAHGKGHEVHYIDAELAWQFISRFSRNPDGSLNDSKI